MLEKCCLCGKEEVVFYKRMLSESMSEYSLRSECASVKATLDAKFQGANIRDRQISKSEQYIKAKLDENRYIEPKVKKYFE